MDCIFLLEPIIWKKKKKKKCMAFYVLNHVTGVGRQCLDHPFVDSFILQGIRSVVVFLSCKCLYPCVRLLAFSVIYGSCTCYLQKKKK
jgi:hypothetical protein